jgi:hypothetical protein
VEKNLLHHFQAGLNSAIKIVELKHLEKDGSWQEKVYDLEVEDCHEYFANGVLVHNCADALRYAIATFIFGKDSQVEYNRIANNYLQELQGNPSDNTFSLEHFDKHFL